MRLLTRKNIIFVIMALVFFAIYFGCIIIWYTLFKDATPFIEYTLSLIIGVGGTILLYKPISRKYAKVTAIEPVIKKPQFKLVRVDEVENNINEKIYEILYINIEKGTKKKEIVVEGHKLYKDIKNKKLKQGDVF